MSSAAAKFARAGSLPVAGIAKQFAACQLDANFDVPSTTFTQIPVLGFNLDANSTYAFIFDLMITQSVASGIVGLSFTAFQGNFTRCAVNALIANSQTGATYKTGNSGIVLADAVARAVGGPWPCRISGSITTTTTNNIYLRAQRSAGTTTILAASFGTLIQV